MAKEPQNQPDPQTPGPLTPPETASYHKPDSVINDQAGAVVGQPDTDAPKPTDFAFGTPEEIAPSREAQLLAEIDRLKAAAALSAHPAAAKEVKAFKVPKGEEDYVHALVTHKSGVAVDNPRVEPFHPNVYAKLAQTEGFTAEVVHQPKAAKADE